MKYLHFILRLGMGLCDVFSGAMSYKSIVSRGKFAERIPQMMTLVLANTFSLRKSVISIFTRRLDWDTYLASPHPPRMFSS